MNFELEAWEVPPGANVENLSVAIEFGPVSWNGEQTRVSARSLKLASGELWVYLRAQGRPINFIVAAEDSPCFYPANTNSKRLGTIARMALEGLHLQCARPFHLEGQLCLLLSDQALWVAPRIVNFEATFPLPFNARRKPSKLVFKLLQAQWKDANSAVRKAWEWSGKSEREQRRHFDNLVPRWREIHDVMHAIALVVELPKGQRWILQHEDTHNHAPDLLLRLWPWRELVEAHFPAFEPLPASEPDYMREYFRFVSSHIAVYGENASAHEQLEARLWLRDWLRRNAPEQLHLLD